MITKLILEKSEIKLKNKKIYHKSNPSFRNDILRHGIIPRIGLSTPKDSKIDAIIYATDSLNKSDWYDDVWEIDVTKTINEWYLDTNVSGKHKQVFTYTPIPVIAIKLIYKGTGESILWITRSFLKKY